MPVNPFENMPAMLGRHTITAEMFFESLNQLKENGRAKEYIKLSRSDNLDDISALSLLANPASLLKQSKARLLFLPALSYYFVLYCMLFLPNLYCRI